MSTLGVGKVGVQRSGESHESSEARVPGAELIIPKVDDAEGPFAGDELWSPAQKCGCSSARRWMSGYPRAPSVAQPGHRRRWLRSRYSVSRAMAGIGEVGGEAVGEAM